MITPRFSWLAAIALASAPVGAAEIVNEDFETDSASEFTVHNAAGDFVANFNYDYSGYAPASGTTGPSSIPQAPSGTGTHALRLEANNNDGNAATDAVTVFPNAAAGLVEYTMTFDAWIQYNGPAAGGTGSTEYITYGGNAAGTGVEWANGSSSQNSFLYAQTGEGGALLDYRLYTSSNSTMSANDGLANFLGANVTSGEDPAWQAIFTVPPYETAGVAGKAWTVVKLDVSATSVTLSFKPSGAADFVQVSNFTPPVALAGGYPFVGYMDIFSSIAGVPADNFGLVDNLRIVTPDAAVINWSVY